MMAEVITMPKLGFDMAEGTLVRWVVQEGEGIAKGAILAEIETDKATVEVESAYEGMVAKHLVPVGEIIPVNTPMAVIAAPGEEVNLEALLGEEVAQVTAPKPTSPPAPQPIPAAPPPSAPAPSEESLPGGVKASPLARRMADEMGIDLRQVQGSGSGRRVVKKDIEAYLAAPPPPAPPTPSPPAIETPSPPLAPIVPLPTTSPPESKRVPLDRLRAIIGRRMSEVKQGIPHFYVTSEYDVEALMAQRKQANALLPEEEKISVNDFILKAVALTLRQFPNLNASLDDDHIMRHGGINVGVAVAVEGGLLTVVCRDTDRKPLRQIASEVKTMIARARAGKVRPEDIEGSTFSVSNLGMYDVEHFIAIINPPEAAILAVGSAMQVPVIKGGEVVPGWRMKATISVDHRVSDGAEAARFLKTLADYLEEPLRLLL
jgi:pyruvate dehydrogenase E2 component (dihydrolipoamide acetyltransferase)